MKDATEIIVVLDKSGSMSIRQNDSIGGFNTFLKEQKECPGEANLTLILFDTAYRFIHKGVPIKDVPELTHKTYLPGGNTALNDAVARAIIETGVRLSEMPEPERPDKVICVILTDGEENASVENTTEQVKSMVQHQEEKYSWKFIYLGIGIDAFANANQVGINQMSAMDFMPSSVGVRSAYSVASSSVSDYRSGKDVVLKK